MGRRKLLENRDELILEAANKLFRKYGYEKTTMDDIAQEAGVGKGSIYVDFPGKSDILISLIKMMMHQRLAKIQVTLQTAPQDKARLRILKDILCNHAINVFDDIQEGGFSPELMAMTVIRIKVECQDFFTTMRQNITHLIEQAIERKEIPAIDPIRASELILIGFSSLMPPYRFQNSREQHLDNIDDVLSLLIAGLKEGINLKGKSGCIGLP